MRSGNCSFYKPASTVRFPPVLDMKNSQQRVGQDLEAHAKVTHAQSEVRQNLKGRLSVDLAEIALWLDRSS